MPEFKKGNYSKGVSDTIDAYIATIRNKGNAPVNQNTATRPSTGTTGSSGILGLFCCAGVVLLIVLIILSRSKGGPTKGDRNRWGGGSGSAWPWIIGSVISSGLSSGSSSSSSDWGGSSGGFGGFGGGGDFGGGGAGGSW